MADEEGQEAWSGKDPVDLKRQKIHEESKVQNGLEKENVARLKMWDYVLGKLDKSKIRVNGISR